MTGPGQDDLWRTTFLQWQPPEGRVLFTLFMTPDDVTLFNFNDCDNNTELLDCVFV